jgi:CDP-paratose 2-epimerase
MRPVTRTLITGGAGFVGTNLADRIASEGGKVVVLDNLARDGVEENLRWLTDTHGGAIDVEIADLTDAAAVRRAVADADRVFHLAGQVAVTTSLVDPGDDLATNLLGTFNVLEAARERTSPPNVVFTSTNKVYGGLPDVELIERDTRYEPADAELLAGGIGEWRPLSFCTPYGCSKGAADQYVRDYARVYGIPATVFRMSCIAGPRQFGNEDQGWVAHFLYSALHGRPVTLYGDGRQVRDILAVEDLMRAFEAARTGVEATAGEIFNVGGGRANTASLLELMSEIEAVTGRRLEYGFDEPRAGDQLIYITDTEKLRQATGWQPQLTVRQTLENIYAFWKSQRRNFEAQYGPAMDPRPIRTAQPVQVAS